jgi:hypothetical protein
VAAASDWRRLTLNYWPCENLWRVFSATGRFAVGWPAGGNLRRGPCPGSTGSGGTQWRAVLQQGGRRGPGLSKVTARTGLVTLSSTRRRRQPDCSQAQVRNTAPPAPPPPATRATNIPRTNPIANHHSKSKHPRHFSSTEHDTRHNSMRGSGRTRMKGPLS